MGDVTDWTTPASSTPRLRTNRFRLATQDYLKLVSNLAIPLIIGVFTIVISIHQQNVAQGNRDKDAAEAALIRLNDIEQARIQREDERDIARKQREEDKNLSRWQREEDRNLSRRRRDEDRELARLQRIEDKETARLQRELDLQIARDKRQLEYELAQEQMISYQLQRVHEVEIAQQNYWSNLKLVDDRRKENILINYQRQLAKLLLYNSSQNTITPRAFALILQMRTRAAFRLLNFKRRSILVHSLSQADLLDKPWVKDLSPLYRVNCSGVDFGVPVDHKFSRFLVQYDHLDIHHADVRYATFRFVSIVSESPSFAYSNLDYTDWFFAELSFTEFADQMTLNYAVFAESYLTSVTFKEISMNGVSFEHNRVCEYCAFTNVSLRHAHLNHTLFHYGKFTYSSLVNANMSNGTFFRVTFEHSVLDRVDLSNADLFGSTFRNVSMVNCTMTGVKLNQTSFINTDPAQCKGYRRN